MDIVNESSATFEELISKYDYVPPRRGHIREVMILSISEHDMKVDLGAKRDGIILQSDLAAVDPAYRDALKVGDAIPVAITRLWDGDEIVVSLRLGLQQEDWLRAERLMQSGELATCEVVETNRGGLVVRFGPLNGFVPNSHLGASARAGQPDRVEEAKAALVGQNLLLAVIEVDQARRRLVFSRRGVERRLRQKLLEELAPGQVRTGVVRSIVSFGVFVDLGGMDGLVHISELDWQHTIDPSDVVRIGDLVQVYVLSVDAEQQRVGLSRKRLLPDPWDQVSEQLQVGDEVQGTVTAVRSFGLLVDIGQGVRGLIRNGQLSGEDLSPDATTLQGSPVRATVLRIDAHKHQIELELVGDLDIVEADAKLIEGQSPPDIEALAS